VPTSKASDEPLPVDVCYVSRTVFLPQDHERCHTFRNAL